MARRMWAHESSLPENTTGGIDLARLELLAKGRKAVR